MKTMSKTRLLVTTALAAYVGPRLAKDKKFDVLPYVKDLNAKNYGSSIKGMVTKLCKDAEPMLAPEAGGAAAKIGPDDVIHMLASHIIGGAEPSPEAIETDEIPMEMEEATDPVQFDAAPLMDFLKKCGLDEAKLGEVQKMLPGAAEDTDEPVENEEEKVTKEAMDKAIKKAADDSAARVKKDMLETAEAREFVRPWVGTVPMALDSATKVYQAACGTLKIEGAEKVVDNTALRLLIESRPKAGARPDVPANDERTVDADTMAALNKRFAHASSINIQG